ncbi:MAG: hypothetical protein KIT22_03380 [Verrucomicrobiae bacterium]|nr:hypothetical protein [Verrucomicrobiae bacterium]
MLPESQKLATLDLDDEYTAIRAEIVTWIQVEYTLIVATATVPAVALSLMTGANSGWPWFSALLLFVISFFNYLTSFARAKIMQASAYITAFHSSRTFWEHVITQEMRKSPGIANRLTTIPLLLFYICVAVAVIVYPASRQSSNPSAELTWKNLYILLPPTLAFLGIFIWITLQSSKVTDYRAQWLDLQSEQLNTDRRNDRSVNMKTDKQGPPSTETTSK